MKRQLKPTILAAALFCGLTGCSMTHSSASNKSVMKSETVDHAQVKWQVFKGVNWSKNHKGLKIRIKNISVTKNMPNIELDNQKTPAIKISFNIQNKSSRPFSINPDAAVLNTSIETYIVPDDHISNDHQGDIKLKPGDSKSGSIGYYLKPGEKVNKISWIEWKVTATKYLVNDQRDKSYDTGKIKIQPS